MVDKVDVMRGFAIPVIGQMGWKDAVTIAQHAALISRSIQRGVVGYHRRANYTTHNTTALKSRLQIINHVIDNYTSAHTK